MDEAQKILKTFPPTIKKKKKKKKKKSFMPSPL